MLNHKWSQLDALNGWLVHSEFEELAKRAALKRNPNNIMYLPGINKEQLSDDEEQMYGELNDSLHDQIEQACKEYFSETPVPPELQEEYDFFTPFTYQNPDWYGRSYMCGVHVIANYITAELLCRFQALLQGDLKDWCIEVLLDYEDLGGGDTEMYIYSDQILVAPKAAKAMGVPRM